jgi:hypothetical protein
VPNVGFIYGCAKGGGIHQFETSETRAESFDFDTPFGWQSKF